MSSEESQVAFAWFDELLGSVRSRKFFVLDRPASPLATDASSLALPPDYAAFLAKYGRARLFREWGTNIYLVGVFRAGVKEPWTLHNGESVLPIGFRGSASLCCTLESEPRLVEVPWTTIRRRFESFDAWLRQACAWGRKQFKQREWRAIERGPRPFTPEELNVVAARRCFRWTQAGVDPSGDCLFDVHNGSDRSLPFLSIGIHAGDPVFEGGVRLSVDRIAPGSRAIVACDCYRTLADPRTVIAFELPDPLPEDRHHYWEFGKPPPLEELVATY